jgi:hypothetical protein
VVAGLNNGLMVVITAINPWCNDGATPYRIRRVDGQPIPSTLNSDGAPMFFKGKECWSAGHKLRRIDPDALDDADVREAELQA